MVLAAAGDVPTQEILAAAQLLRDHTPELITRVVNVVDLMALLTPTEHPHGFGERVFLDLFSAQTDVVFAFHGYSRAVHELIHGRPSPERFHVRGFSEQGTTTTPFDMVVLNKMSRYHLVIEALRRSKRSAGRGVRVGGVLPHTTRKALALHRRAPRRHAGSRKLDLVLKFRTRPSWV